MIKIMSSSGSNIEENSLENTAYAVVPVETESYVPDYFDTYFEETGKYIIKKNQASIRIIQLMFKIGFNRASRIMDQL